MCAGDGCHALGGCRRDSLVQDVPSKVTTSPAAIAQNGFVVPSRVPATQNLLDRARRRHDLRGARRVARDRTLDSLDLLIGSE